MFRMIFKWLEKRRAAREALNAHIELTNPMCICGHRVGRHLWGRASSDSRLPNGCLSVGCACGEFKRPDT